MKKIIFNYIKPQNYYNRLLTFFCIISILMSMTLYSLNFFSFEIFLLNFIIIFFLLVLISALVEFFYSGEYIGPIEIYNLEFFFNSFLECSNNKKKLFENYFHKYDIKSKKNFEKVFHKNPRFFLSTIRKENDIFIISFISDLKLFEFYILKFFAKNSVHKIYVKEIKNSYKIIRLV